MQLSHRTPDHGATPDASMPDGAVLESTYVDLVAGPERAAEAWEHLVPPVVISVANEWGTDARIRG